MDINPEGRLIASVDNEGTCLVSEIDTQAYLCHKKLGPPVGTVKFSRLSVEILPKTNRADGKVQMEL